MAAALPFTSENLLAPMDGVTDPCFRELVLERNGPDALGGAFTEFVRVVDHALPERVLHRNLGTRRFPQPVGLQLMGSDRAAVAETARRAVEAGAPLVDLNFGCPARGALRGCAGSGMLDAPADIEALLRAVVDAVAGAAPVTGKIRAGGDDDSRLEEIARAVENGGASLLTIHCRTRAEKYTGNGDWTRVARAVAAVSIPVCGNGGIERHSDLARMRAETGCAFTMVGRAALGDPWIFTGRDVATDEAARFLVQYDEVLRDRGGADARARAGRVKQLLQRWVAGDLVGDARVELLREKRPEALLERIADAARPLQLARGGG
jgi:tRNA-dihydrouridine synthase C